MSNLSERLRKRADSLMPEWAYASSAYWYDGGGRRDRNDARLLREAADEIDELKTSLSLLSAHVNAAMRERHDLLVGHPTNRQHAIGGFKDCRAPTCAKATRDLDQVAELLSG